MFDAEKLADAARYLRLASRALERALRQEAIALLLEHEAQELIDGVVRAEELVAKLRSANPNVRRSRRMLRAAIIYTVHETSGKGRIAGRAVKADQDAAVLLACAEGTRVPDPDSLKKWRLRNHAAMAEGQRYVRRIEGVRPIDYMLNRRAGAKR